MNANANREKWISLIQQCRSSGMTVKDWCRQNNIGLSTFYHWQKIIFSQMVVATETDNSNVYAAPVQSKTEFAELIISDDINSAADKQAATAKISIGTTTIEIFQPMTPALLKVLIQGAANA